MSLVELKEQARALSHRDRFELAAFLAELEDQSEPDFRRAVDHRMQAMDRGAKVGGEQFEAEHRRRQ